MSHESNVASRRLVVGGTIHPVIYALIEEVDRQDAKHGPFEGTTLGRSRLAIACLEDEVEEAREAWRSERKALTWDETRAEVLQVAAVAIRTLRDAL
jgi:hypothetical protein